MISDDLQLKQSPAPPQTPVTGAPHAQTIDQALLASLLRRVEKPARYSGGEYNRILPTGQEKGRLLLSYPDVYEIGFSNQGLKILYDRVQKHSELYADMFFTPWPDMGQAMADSGLPLFGLNSKIEAKHFDVWALNLCHELLMTNILYMLDLSQVPRHSKERTAAHPYIIIGGTAITNPLPLVRFADGMFMGDGEEAIIDIAETVVAARAEGLPRAEVLKRLAEIDGLYIPSVAPPRTRGGAVTVDAHVTKRTFRAPKYSTLETVMVPNMQLVQDGVVVEVNRGCGQGCRFCHAGFWKRPVRNVETTTIVNQAKEMTRLTGYSELSLHSLSIADYPFLEDLALQVSEWAGPRGIRFSFPSLRVSFKTIPVVELTQSVRKANLTFALESGSELQRERIHKKSSEENLLEIIQEAFNRGWDLVKVYFMLGLPGATQEEEAHNIAAVLNKMGQLAERAGGRHQINTTISLFVPKPFTTYQWEEQRSPEYFQKSMQIIRQEVTSRRVKLSFPDPGGAWIEGLLSRADHRVADVIEAAYEAGAIFDSWDEWFRMDAWQSALDKLGREEPDLLKMWVGPLDPAKHKVRPWDFIGALRPGYLTRDLEKADNITEENMRPPKKQSWDDMDPALRQGFEKALAQDHLSADKFEIKSRLKISYSIGGSLVYTGHQDKTNMLQRTLRRAGLPMTFTQGHHKIERLHYGPPLPVYHYSEQEFIWVDLYEDWSSTHVGPTSTELLHELNRVSPDGLHFAALEYVTKPYFPTHTLWQLDFTQLAEKKPALWREFSEGKNAPLLQVYLEKTPTEWAELAKLPARELGDYEPFFIRWEQTQNRIKRRKRVKKLRVKTKLIPACIIEPSLNKTILTYSTETNGGNVLQPEKLLGTYGHLKPEDLALIRITRKGFT